MERNFDLKIGISNEAAKSLGINEDTVFETYFEDGYLLINAYSEEESKRILLGAEQNEDGDYESFDEAYADGLDDGHVEGYEAGYRIGYSHCLNDRPYDPDYPGDEVLDDESDCRQEDCAECEFFCSHCGKCVFDE